jgi:hypothetical protein
MTTPSAASTGHRRGYEGARNLVGIQIAAGNVGYRLFSAQHAARMLNLVGMGEHRRWYGNADRFGRALQHDWTVKLATDLRIWA